MGKTSLRRTRPVKEGLGVLGYFHPCNIHGGDYFLDYFLD